MKEIRKKQFGNGIVYLLNTDDGYPIETTDTFLPYYTKDAIGRKQNALEYTDVGSRAERWMLGVSVMSGCPIRCKFCATAQLKKCRNLSAYEIVEQVRFITENNYPKFKPWNTKEFKINYTRMGEPFLNLENVIKGKDHIDSMFPNVHHYISTIGIKGSDFSWIEGNTTLQISLHALDEERRNWLIPYKNKMSIEELGKIRTNSNLKTTINLTLVDEKDFDIGLLSKYFDPKYFFIKLSPLNRNCISDKNNLNGIIEQKNLA